MFNPRGNMPPRPRGPNAPGPIPRGPFHGPEPGPGGLQRHGMPQRFMGSDMRAGFPRPNVQVTQHRMDPRQAREKVNVQRQQKGEGHTTRWDTPFTPGNNSQNQPASGRIAEQTTSVQSRYTSESASSILASFGLSNEDLEELSRYPDDQLTPENMPLILRDIRIHKMTRNLPSLPSQSREKASFSKDDGHGSMVKSKVIDYGHESKYGYTKSPLDVKVYGSDVPNEQSMKGFQAQETAAATTASSNVPSNALNAVEELIRQMGFQRSTPATQTFFSMDAANKVPGLCLPPAGHVVPPAVQPMMPPVVSPMPQPVAQQALPPPPVVQPMMPAMNQPPPPFVPEILEAVNRHGRIQCESRGNAPHGPMGGQKTFQKEPESPIESPFGVVKASWLPVFSQADAQKMKRLPTPSMMNDYYAASPRIFPHMCSLCNVECRHLKDWIQHQNTTAHIESCRQLRQQYPDWNPEAHSFPKRREGDRKENHNVRRRSASPSPKRSRRSSSGHGRHRSRSRSPGRLRAGRRLPSPRHRSRSPRRSQDSSSWSRRSCSRERGLGRSTESPDQALEDAVKCLGPRFVEQFNRQKSLHMFSRETSGPKKMSPELGKALGRMKKPPSAPVGPPKPSKMDLLSQSGSSKPFEAADTSVQGGMVADGKNKKLPLGAPTKEASVAAPAPYNRLLTDKLLRCGTVLHITDLPDDGFSDHDIKKIVQPFGKVSDLLVLRSRNEAFLEMNYKEAATAAIKYSNTVPVVINRRRVKISIAEKPPAPFSQNKGNLKMITKTVKKPPLSIKKEQTNSAEKITKPTAPATLTPNPAKTTIKKPGEPPKVMEKAPMVAKKSGATKAAAEPKMPADSKKLEEAKKALESKKTTEPRKVAESKAKEVHKPAQVPGTTEAVKSTEAGESTVTEAEETCVVVISNLPEAGLTLDDVSNLTKPFGGLKDLLIVSSHKKAYLEISRTPAESLVKFYNCFPKWVEKNQLSFAVASEFKDVKNEEAIFVAMIKDANPKVNTEALHSQFVYLGNLPDGGYSELEILCVGLRFGRVDHYMVITNKNKAILQLDSSESASSMCRFLKRYPYSLGDSQLTFSRTPTIEPSTVEVTKREVKKVEPSKESPDLKKIPEGSGVVHPAAVPSAKPLEAKEEPSSSSKAKIPEGKKTEHSVTVKMICEAPAKPFKIEASEGGCAVVVTVPADIPTDLGSSEKQLEEALALPPELEKDGKILDIGNEAELLENVSTSATGNGGNKLSVCAGELSEELQSKAKTESLGSDFARTEEKEEVPAAHGEAVSPDSAEAPVEVLGGDLQSSSKLTSKADGSDASGNLAEMPATKIGVLIDKEAEAPFSTDEADLKVQSLTPLGETVEAKKKKSELQTVEGEAAAEKQNEVPVLDLGPTTEKKPENNANEESSEQILQKAQANEDTEEAQSEEPSKASTLATESTPSLAASSISKTILKAVISVPRITKTRTATRKKEAQKPATKMGTRSQTAAEKKPVPKEMSQQTPTSSRPNVPDGSKPKLSVNSPVVKVGSGKSSSRQDKNSRVETKGSSNQTSERDSRSSSMKRDNGINKVSTGKNTRSSKSSTKSKEEEELFPFNLDEFVTVDEVTDEVDSPSQSRKNLPRAKRKEPAKKSTPSEPTLKRKKGKNSSVCAAVAELSFVTLDEIGEDEGGMAQAAEPVHLGAMPDPQVLVTVDEVNEEEEEEQISEVVRDPQLLVTLDEISEQEESAAKDAFPLGEPDLKAGPLVTVDEIGEVEELPLSEPLHFKVDETSKPEEEERQASQDLGDFLSSEMPDDPSALVTVDEIHEDGEDQPLVTLDEVAEDDEDFLADFNRLKEELNFVTVDEVGSEDDTEEQDNIFTGIKMEKSVAGTVSAGETRMQISEPGENVIPAKPDEAVVSAEPEVMGIPDDTPLEMRVSAGDELSEKNKSSEVHVKATEKQSSAAEINLVEATLVKAGKDEKKADLEKNKLSDIGCEQQFTEPVLNRTEWSDSKEQNVGKDQKPSESGSHEEDTVMKATEMEVAGSSLSTSNEKETAGEVQMSSLDLDVSVADTRTAKADELARGSELCGRDRSVHPDASLKEESCSDVTPSQSSEKSEPGVTDSECKEPESKRRKIESAENSNVSSQLKGLDFLVPKAGFFCQICSLFCVDEASMKTHCQTQLHEQNMQKFMIKNAQEEEKKDGEENAEEQSSR